MSGKVKLKSIDRVIKSAAEQAVDEALADRVAGEGAAAVLDGPNPFLVEPPGDPAPTALDDLFKSIPQGDGYYLKLYREMPPAGWEFKLRIDDYSSWSDIETEVASIVRHHTRLERKKWGSGRYRLLAMREGKPGVYSRPIILHVDAMEDSEPPRSSAQDQPPPPPSYEGGPKTAKEQVAEMSELLQSVKSLVGGGPSPTDMQKMLADAFALGAQSNPKKADDSGDLLKTIAVLKELGLIGKPAEPAFGPRDMMAMMKEMMSAVQPPPPPPPKDDFLETIQKFKAVGLIPEPKTEDPFSMIEKMRALMEVMRPLMGGGGGEGEPTSPVMEAVRIIGPHVPKMVERITGSIDRVADLKARQFTGGVPTAPPARPTPPAVIRHNPRPAPAPVPEALEPEEDNEMHPIVKEIHDAVMSEDHSFFPKMQQLLNMYVGPHAIPELVSGRMPVEEFTSQLATALGQPFLNSEQSQSYFRSFLASLSPQPDGAEGGAPAPLAEGGIVGQCQTCGVEFDYHGEAEWEADNKVCECGGPIARKGEEA